MRTRISSWIRLGVVVVVITGAQTGCKSGWKMPGADMFSWTRKPSESTLTGTSPSLTMPSNASPTSPAQRNNPSPLVSSAANSGRPAGYGAPNSAGNYGGPGLAATGAPGAGAAATANGYSTGPYQTTALTRPNGPVAPSGYGVPPGQTGYGSATPTVYVAPTGVPPQGMPGPSFAPPPSAMAQSPAPGGYAAPSYAPMGTNGPAQPPAFASNNGYGAPNHTNIASTLPAAFPQANSAPPVQQQAYNGPSSAYQPGSNARKTSYDFSSQSQGSVAGSGFPPPANYPATASGPTGSMNR